MQQTTSDNRVLASAHARKTERWSYLSLYTCMYWPHASARRVVQHLPQHTHAHTHARTIVSPSGQSHWWESNGIGLVGRFLEIKAFLSLSLFVLHTPLFSSLPHSLSPLSFPYHQHIKSLRGNSNWWMPFNEFTHGYVLQSFHWMKNWGEPVRLKLRLTWWNASLNEFSHMQMYSNQTTRQSIRPQPIWLVWMPTYTFFHTL